MKLILEIRLKNSEGALERILGRLRQRSFALCGIVATFNTEEGSIDARITVEGTRAAEPMLRQIIKLYDVESAKMHSDSDSVQKYRPFHGQREAEAYVTV